MFRSYTLRTEQKDHLPYEHLRQPAVITMIPGGVFMNRQAYHFPESLELISNVASMPRAEKIKHLHVKLGDIFCMKEGEDAILKDVGNNLVLKICFRIDEDKEYKGMLQLTKSLARVLTLPLSGLADAALAAAENAAPATFQSIQSLLMDSDNGDISDSPLLSEVQDEDIDPFSIYILSSSIRTYGASALYYPGVQEKISQLVGGSYYILPSSVHEVLILPDLYPIGSLEPRSLSEIVKLVNEQELQEADLLSYRVLYYDGDSGILRDASPKRICESV